MSATVIDLPQKALVITLGAAGSGKSTFVEEHCPPTSIVSSDQCRMLVSDDIMSQSCNPEAFTLFHTWIEQRLKLGRLTVADATNLRAKSRQTLREIAARYSVPVYLWRFETPEERCVEQNANRERAIPEEVIHRHYSGYQSAREDIYHEKYAGIVSIDISKTYRVEVSTDVLRLSASGFDCIGDLHGCVDELRVLLWNLGYRVKWNQGGTFTYEHPAGRKLVFVGDITDRGPNSLECLNIVYTAWQGGHAATVGNHCNKLYRALKGNSVKMAHGLAGTWEELQRVSQGNRDGFREMLAKTPYQVICEVAGQPQLVVCHAGIPTSLVGVESSYARNHALYGEVLGFKDGLPQRGDSWVKTWESGPREPFLVHGHTVSESPWYDAPVNICNVDGGCAFGGELRAFRWPEREVVSVPAARLYFDSGDGRAAERLEKKVANG